MALVNSSFDPAVELDIVLLTASATIRVFDMNGEEDVVHAGRSDGPYRHFTLPMVEPWSMRLVVNNSDE
ncbi:MAG: hypothetical protein A2W31_17055 [Planctomycetes bacterium RBG_16_64_10]|nr:MAG: hypothetical protein A2W31_17055 [Planctomycetes bacterium RBG_16_64_10]